MLSLFVSNCRTAEANKSLFLRLLPASVALLTLVGCGGSSNSNSGSRSVGKAVYINTTYPSVAKGESAAMASSELYVINSDGTSKTRVIDTNEPVYYYSPRLSQDGSKIVVLSSRDNCGDTCTINAQGIPSPLQVWIMNTDGSQAKPLTHLSDPSPYSQPAQSPALSSDGSKVIYSDRKGVTLMDVSSLGQTRFGGEQYAFPYSASSLSPDGTKIAYSYNGIFTMNIDGTNKKKIVDHASEPSFSPDGSQITYTTYSSDFLSDGFSSQRSYINIANSDGTGQKRLTVDSGVNYSPSFSNDGKSIIFKQQVTPSYLSQVRVVTVNLDGSVQTSVTVDGQ